MTKLHVNKLTKEEQIQIIKEGYDATVNHAKGKLDKIKSGEVGTDSERKVIDAIYDATIKAVDTASESLTSAILNETDEKSTLEVILVAQILAVKEMYLEQKEIFKSSLPDMKSLGLFCAGHFELISNTCEYIIESGKYEYDEDLKLIHDLAVLTKEEMIDDISGEPIKIEKNPEKLKELLKEIGIDASDISEVSSEEVEAKLREAGKDVKVVEVKVDADIAEDRDALNGLLKDVIKKVIKEERSKTEKSKRVSKSIREELDKVKENKEDDGLSFGDKVIKVYSRQYQQ